MPEYAVISHGDTRPQVLLHSYVGLLFNFNYGIQTLDVTDFKGAISAIAEHGRDIKCTILIQNGLVPPDIGISGFNMNGQFPLFCVVPSTVAKDYEAKCSRIENAHVCTWEESFRKGGSFLRELIESILTRAYSKSLCVRLIFRAAAMQRLFWTIVCNVRCGLGVAAGPYCVL